MDVKRFPPIAFSIFSGVWSSWKCWSNQKKFMFDQENNFHRYRHNTHPPTLSPPCCYHIFQCHTQPNPNLATPNPTTHDQETHTIATPVLLVYWSATPLQAKLPISFFCPSYLMSNLQFSCDCKSLLWVFIYLFFCHEKLVDLCCYEKSIVGFLFAIGSMKLFVRYRV